MDNDELNKKDDFYIKKNTYEFDPYSNSWH